MAISSFTEMVHRRSIPPFTLAVVWAVVKWVELDSIASSLEVEALRVSDSNGGGWRLDMSGVALLWFNERGIVEGAGKEGWGGMNCMDFGNGLRGDLEAPVFEAMLK